MRFFWNVADRGREACVRHEVPPDHSLHPSSTDNRQEYRANIRPDEGRADPTPSGRGCSYQSLPSVSPPFGVHAAHQVLPLTPEEIPRTLPSAIPACMLGWAVCVRRGSHCEAGPVYGCGENCGFEPGPMLIIVIVGCAMYDNGGTSQNVHAKPG